MKKTVNIGTEAAKRVIVVMGMFAAIACSKSLDSVDGPETGMISGLVCNDLPTLSAVVEMPAIKDTLVKDGKCLSLRSRAKVNFVRTVMMPGDGKYSQFEYKTGDTTRKLWIRTSNVR